MIYEELLKETANKKRKAISDINRALRGPGGFLAEAEIERSPGMVARLWLAKDFCEAVADHISDWLDSEEACRIYIAYEDDDPDLYSMLPVEAQLFTEEVIA